MNPNNKNNLYTQQIQELLQDYHSLLQIKNKMNKKTQTEPIQHINEIINLKLQNIYEIQQKIIHLTPTNPKKQQNK